MITIESINGYMVKKDGQVRYATDFKELVAVLHDLTDTNEPQADERALRSPRTNDLDPTHTVASPENGEKILGDYPEIFEKGA